MSDEEIPNNSSLDAMHHVPGHYGFAVQAETSEDHEVENVPKNINHTFSRKLNRLYVKKKSLCTFSLSTTDIPPGDSKIKIYVYSEDHVPVMTCPSHTDLEATVISPWHYLRSKNPQAVYECCAETGELSIELPWVSPEAVTENFETLTFMCSSKHCIKKELFIKFSLVDSGDVVLGHHVFGLHVCSTPGRDRLNHENKTKKVLEKKRKRKMPTDSDYSAEAEAERTESERRVYHLPVKGKWRQVILDINRGLELLRAVPKNVQDTYLERYYASLDSEPVSTSTSTNSSATCTMTTADIPSTSSDTRFTLRRILVRS